MQELYDLNRDKSRYSSMEENLKKIIDILSDNRMSDNLLNASRNIKSNYLLNDVSKSSTISNVRDQVINQRDDLITIYNNVRTKIRHISTQIDDLESQ